MVTVGSVPYVNAIPLASWFDELGDESPVRVLYDVPSRLPDLLESGGADSILVSSVDALRVPGRRMAAGVCIGTDGPVKSVRMFAKKPFDQVATLALDASSMTSNRLAQILLHERYGMKPSVCTMKPDLREMLGECDACVLIGDIGMVADGAGLHVADMGEEWRLLTGKPFVWAAWIGGDRLTRQLTGWLQVAKTLSRAGRTLSGQDLRGNDAAQARRQRLVDRAVTHGWSEAMVRDYFFNVMVYDMDDHVLAGLREYQARLLANGFDDCIHFPEIVTAPDFDDFRRLAAIEAPRCVSHLTEC